MDSWGTFVRVSPTFWIKIILERNRTWTQAALEIRGQSVVKIYGSFCSVFTKEQKYNIHVNPLTLLCIWSQPVPVSVIGKNEKSSSHGSGSSRQHPLSGALPAPSLRCPCAGAARMLACEPRNANKFQQEKSLFFPLALKTQVSNT